MLQRGIVPVALLLTCLTSVRAEEPTWDRAATIAQSIERLGSRNYAQRKKANEFLSQQTDALTVKLLEQATKARDGEIRQRALALHSRARLRHETIRRLAPAMINVGSGERSLEQMVQEVEKHLYLKLDNNARKLLTRTIKTSEKKWTVWEALDLISQSAQLTLKRPDIVEESKPQVRIVENGNRTIIWLDQRHGNVPEPVEINRELSLTTGQTKPATYTQGAMRICAWPGNKAGGGNVLLTFHLEKRFQWMHLVALHVKSAVDDQGQQRATPEIHAQQSMTIPNDTQEILLVWDGVTQWPQTGGASQQMIRLAKASKPASALKSLEGTLKAKIKVPVETLLHVANIKQAKGRILEAANGARFHVVSMERKGTDFLKVDLEITGKQQTIGGAPIVGQNVRILNRGRRRAMAQEVQISVLTPPELRERGLAILDERGQELTLSNAMVKEFPQLTGKRETYSLTYRLKKDQQGRKQLRYRGTNEVIIDVPFKLKNVPLSR